MYGDDILTRWVSYGTTQNRQRQCAKQLLAARVERLTLPRWSEALRPLNSAQAWGIQDTVARHLGNRTLGWKLGCTSVEMQRKLGSDGPIAGRVFDGALHWGDACLRGARADNLGLEAEFAFTLGRDLPPRAAVYERAEVDAAIASLHPAIEQVESRFTAWQGLPIHDIVADNASHGRLVIGPAIADWRDMDLPASPIRLLSNGQVLAEGRGSLVLGDPMQAMVWLANHLRERGIGLLAGQVVTTGTCTGLTMVQPDIPVTVDLAGAATVTLVFEDTWHASPETPNP